MNKIKNNKNEAFTAGLIWNYISLIFMAAGGFCFSLLIGIFYDAETLGYFNTFYALYIGVSQLAVFGCQNAVTKYASETPDNIERAKSYLVTANIVVLAVSVILNIVVRLFLMMFSRYFEISIIEINAMLFGVLFFAINKVVLGYLNGLSRMKAYGIFQTLRYIFIAVFIVVFSLLKLSREYLILTFWFSEGLLFLCELPFVLKDGTGGISVSMDRIKKVVKFGYHILPANLVLDLNSKADVLCLSFVTRDERLVGIYSFAILFAEGFYQVFVVIRRSINPKISYNYVNGKLNEFYGKVTGLVRRYGYFAATLCGIMLVIVFRVACLWLKDPTYTEGTLSLIIVNVSIVVNVISIIWGNLLSQIGQPKLEARVNIVTILSNVVMNIIFISLFGMIGAAIGTALSYFAFSLIQHTYFKRFVGE